MIRAVLDPNVIISAALSAEGSPAAILRRWLGGQLEAIVSPLLLAELERALAYRKIRRRITTGDADELLELLSRQATMVADPPGQPPVHSSDPGDDYLISLAASSSAVLVSGDRHLLDLHGRLPVFTPAAFLAMLHDRPE